MKPARQRPTSAPQRNPLYAAMVKSLDDAVGRLLAAVDEAGIADRTIIVFFSDNGGWAFPPKATDPKGFDTIPATSNLPLRSGKASLYEGGTREPCVVVWPQKVEAGTTNDGLLQSIDWYPTLLSMCGLERPAGLRFDGLDQSPMLLEQGPVPGRLFCHFPHGSRKVAEDIPGFLPGTSVRRGDWQDVTVNVPAEAPFGILRVYLPAQKQPVDVDWVEVSLKKNAPPRRWDF